jgi:drug/metabolite transporter (DMT)-like permease
MNRHATRLPPTLLALAAVLLWSSFAALSVRLRGTPPLLLAGTALLIGSCVSLHRLREWRAPWRVVALGVYGLFTYHLALFLALRLAPAVEANLLNYLWPLLIVVLTPVFFRGRPLTRRHVIAALFGFAGAALLVTGGHVAFNRAHLPGHLLAIAAAVIWATYSLATSRLGTVSTSLVGLFCALSGMLALAGHFAFEPRYVFAARDVPWLLLLGVGPMGLAFFAWDAALKRGDPRVIGSLSYVTPLLSTTLLAVTGGGRLSAVSLGAMALIVGGALLGTWPSRRAN